MKRPAHFLRRLTALVLALSLALCCAGCARGRELWAELSSLNGGFGTPAEEPAADEASDAPFQMHFLDVGQALSVLVECDGAFLLYDGGNVDDGDFVVSYLQQQGVQDLDLVFCSHAHEDHVGGLSAALDAFPASRVYCSVAAAESDCFQAFVDSAQRQGLAVEVPAAGTTWQLGGATVRLLGPVKQYEDNVNNNSLVLRIDYGRTSFLLTGDMEKDAERDLVESGADLKADVLQVGHHGSSTSTGYLFLDSVLPEIGVISCGVNNDYGHPHQETLDILRDAEVEVFRTDLQGTILVASDGTNCTVTAAPAA